MWLDWQTICINAHYKQKRWFSQMRWCLSALYLPVYRGFALFEQPFIAALKMIAA